MGLLEVASSMLTKREYPNVTVALLRGTAAESQTNQRRTSIHHQGMNGRGRTSTNQRGINGGATGVMERTTSSRNERRFTNFSCNKNQIPVHLSRVCRSAKMNTVRAVELAETPCDVEETSDVGTVEMVVDTGGATVAVMSSERFHK